jgi:hypothetical protein
MVGSSYKRFVSIVNGRQQLQEFYKHFGSSFKFVDDERCNMMIIVAK